jgi:hypothetical protein
MTVAPIRDSVRFRWFCPFGFCQRSPWIMDRLDRQPVVASGSPDSVDRGPPRAFQDARHRAGPDDRTATQKAPGQKTI